MNDCTNLFAVKAYLLADAGYDVWLGNPRGTKPSRRHVRLKPTGWWQKEFWSYSLHELGKKKQFNVFRNRFDDKNIDLCALFLSRVL